MQPAGAWYFLRTNLTRPGLHTVLWDAKGYGSGVCFARPMANGRCVDNRHLVLNK